MRMAKFILATKQNMVQLFADDGEAFSATLLKAGPVVVTQVKTKEKDGYMATQIGYGVKKKHNKPLVGHLKGAKSAVLKEFPLGEGDASLQVGAIIDVSVFTKGEKVTVAGISKGKGFQGVVKRHGFRGGPASHGAKHAHREPGSIGGGLRTHVPKGMRMAGRMGSDRITQKNLKVVAVDAENNLMLVKGAIAGKRGTLVEIVSR